MMHFVIDSYGCNSSRTDNLLDIYEVINKLVDEFQLSPIMPPQLVPYYYCQNPADVGISAFVLLQGGHFTIHTFPEWGCYFADLMCESRFVNKDALTEFMKREFPCSSLFIQLVYREEFAVNDMGAYSLADFGPHYMIASTLEKGCDFNVESLMKLLDTLPPKIGMHPINRPVVLYDKVNDPTYVSGIALIAESHIAIHYNLKERKVLMDIFSCKTVDEKKYSEVMNELFKGNYQDVLIRRGRKNEQRLETQENKYNSHKYWQDVIIDKKDN